jgi:hypothetical protein
VHNSKGHELVLFQEPPLDTVTLNCVTRRNKWEAISILICYHRALALAGTAIHRVQHFFPLGFPAKIIYAYTFLISSMRTKYVTHLIDPITLIMCFEEHKL